MTCINALVRADRVHLFTDGAVYQPDGGVIATMQKVYILAQADAAIAIRGPLYFAPAFIAYLNGSSLSGFDMLIDTVLPAAKSAMYVGLSHLSSEVVEAAEQKIDLKRFDIVLAGWSHDRRRGEIYRIDTTAETWSVEPQGDGLMMPGDNPALIARLQRAGWNLHDEARDASNLLALMHHQRAVDDLLPNGLKFQTVGGFAQHTEISSAGIQTKIIERWC